MNDTDKRDTFERFAAARRSLAALTDFIASGDWGRDEPWGGAGVIVADSTTEVGGNGWSDPLVAVTEHVAELSWAFERARDAVAHLDGFGLWKEEFFGRMAEAVIAAGPDASVRTHLGVAVWAADLTLGHIMDRAIR